MKKHALVILLCCVGFLVAPLAFAAGNKMGGCPMMQKMDKMGPEEEFYLRAFFLLSHADEIGLSDDQLEKIGALKLKIKKSLIMEDAQIETLALDIADALRQDQLDAKKIDGLVDKKYDLKKQRTKEIIQGYIDLRDILTKDQRDKMKKIKPASMMGGMKTMGMMKMGGGAPKEDAGMIGQETEQ
ncbi:hypothetical protein BU251_06425 [Candidatus Velamenicoccus archaeovorus]|uniref:Periplasmic heavy metal sensor n=1 Tax=Velamenicoccus archaeovorus TaxID=1930593 RepID=A0A410P5Z9_VELA1|nr:periplasmic heavy metal sensor [Candidatus Velamenicoccus archaeovorus]QAT17384.1 hypothetical protein BU251_06425 [Candidatus Velamenicoccus archaeovorus]